MEKDKERRQTPIIDGDARPDMPLNPEKEQKKDKKDKAEEPGQQNKFESERGSDLNSLEDFKDAKR